MAADAAPSSSESSISPRLWDVACCLLLAAVLTGLGWRQSKLIVDPADAQSSHAQGRGGMADFRDVIYYPLRSVRDGVNPYDCGTAPLADGTPRYRQRYPVLNLFPLYSPLLFLLYWPFGYGDFYTSAAMYIAVNIALMLVWSYACWRVVGVRPNVGQVAALAGVMLATQSGRANFLGGESAIPLALASLAAVALAPRHPWLAGLALAIASFKPTFGLPLGILLLACGHFRTVALGWGLGFVIGVAGLAIIFSRSGDVGRMPEILRHNQEVLESDPDMDARTSPARFDSAGAIQRLLPTGGPVVGLIASAAVLGLAALGLWRLRRRNAEPEAALLTVSIVSLATVVGIYHLGYDGLLLWAPIVAVSMAPMAFWTSGSARWRWVVSALLLVPMFNVLGTTSVQRWMQSLVPVTAIPAPLAGFLWTLVCTLNGLALFAAMVLLVRQAWRLPAPGTGQAGLKSLW